MAIGLVKTDLQHKKDHLAAIDAFIASPAYEGYQTALVLEIQNAKDAIVAIVPDSIENFVEECLVRGELRALEARLNMFEEARDKLNNRIDAMVEAELQNATERKI